MWFSSWWRFLWSEREGQLGTLCRCLRINHPPCFSSVIRDSRTQKCLSALSLIRLTSVCLARLTSDFALTMCALHVYLWGTESIWSVAPLTEELDTITACIVKAEHQRMMLLLSFLPHAASILSWQEAELHKPRGHRTWLLCMGTKYRVCRGNSQLHSLTTQRTLQNFEFTISHIEPFGKTPPSASACISNQTLKLTLI